MGLGYQKIIVVFIHLWNRITYQCKRKVCTQTELLLERKQACDTDKNQASDEDMHVG